MANLRIRIFKAREYREEAREGLCQMSFYRDEELHVVLCGLCRRDCHVASVKCECNLEPVCIRHEEEMKKCLCKEKRVVYLREDITELESLCRQFEKEDGLMDQVQEQPPFSGFLSVKTEPELEASVKTEESSEITILHKSPSGRRVRSHESDNEFAEAAVNSAVRGGNNMEEA